MVELLKSQEDRKETWIGGFFISCGNVASETSCSLTLCSLSKCFFLSKTFENARTILDATFDDDCNIRVHFRLLTNACKCFQTFETLLSSLAVSLGEISYKIRTLSIRLKN